MAPHAGGTRGAKAAGARYVAGEGIGRLIASIREALIETAVYWHSKILPGHFEPGAMQKYPDAYEPVSKRYAIRKAKAGKGRSPMVLSGAMRTAMLRPNPTVALEDTKTTIKAKLVLTGPHLEYWVDRRKTHDFRKQLSAISEPERAEMTKFMAQRVAQRFDETLGRGAEMVTTEYT